MQILTYAENAESMREKKFIYRILIRKSSRKRPLSSRRQGWEDRRCRDVRGEIDKSTYKIFAQVFRWFVRRVSHLTSNVYYNSNNNNNNNNNNVILLTPLLLPSMVLLIIGI
jgi:hypothetical protein